MEQLQAELKHVKATWGKEVELAKAEKGAEGFPFPVSVTRYTPRPDSAAMWDVDELPVRLVIYDAVKGADSVCVEVDPFLPGNLSEEIESRIEAEWKKGLSGAGDSWLIEETLSWIEAKFGEFLRLLPEVIDSYEGCDDQGATMRRYTLINTDAACEYEEEEVISEEEQARRAQAYIEEESARLMAVAEARDKEAAEKRKLAEDGLGEFKPVQLSKKEKAEMNLSRKEKSGHRWRKTGSKSAKHTLTEEQEKKKKKGGLVS